MLLFGTLYVFGIPLSMSPAMALYSCKVPEDRNDGLRMLEAKIVLLSLAVATAFHVPLSGMSRVGSTRTSHIRAEDEVGDWGVDNLFEMMEEADEKISGLDTFLTTVKKEPSAIEFEQTMAAIEDGFDYAPVAFTCGELSSSAEQNQGSAKIFSLAKLQKLDKKTTLELFGRFYRDDVLGNPDGTDHGNIRNFMKSGWDGVTFQDGLALKAK